MTPTIVIDPEVPHTYVAECGGQCCVVRGERHYMEAAYVAEMYLGAPIDRIIGRTGALFFPKTDPLYKAAKGV